jgi:hypothetical protein
LPADVLGHIGYAVVPWKAGRGYAKRALKLMLEHAHSEGLRYVEITTDPDNVASHRVIEINGGVLVALPEARRIRWHRCTSFSDRTLARSARGLMKRWANTESFSRAGWFHFRNEFSVFATDSARGLSVSR